MLLHDVDLPAEIPLGDAARLVESMAEAEGLRITLRGTLAQHPGSLHWHFKRGREPGTLEVTLLQRERCIRLAVQAGRIGPWTTGAIERLAAALGIIAELRMSLAPTQISRSNSSGGRNAAPHGGTRPGR